MAEIRRLTKEHKIKIGNKLRGKKWSKKRREKFKKNHHHYREGKHHSEESKKKMKKNHPYYWKDKKRSKKDKIKMSNSAIGKHNGEKSHFWKGGITPISMEIRNSLEMKLWRKAVFERDNFTCQKYGTKGYKLIAHHINNFSDFPELRFAIDNGVTLSDKAHREFHKIYGRKNNTREQLKEFLKIN